MKKKVLICVLIFLLSVLMGCKSANLNQGYPTKRSIPSSTSPTISTTTPSSTSAPVWTDIVSYHPYWYVYYTTAELDDHVDHVFEGKVVDITFGVIDERAPGTFITTAIAEPDYTKLKLYTIYEIEVTNVYKGEPGTSVQIAILGGMRGYKEMEQYELLTACGWTPNCIPKLSKAKYLEIGKSYLFPTTGEKDGYHSSLCPAQFALEPGEVPSTGLTPLPSYDEIIAYYSNQSIS